MVMPVWPQNDGLIEVGTIHVQLVHVEGLAEPFTVSDAFLRLRSRECGPGSSR